MFYEQGVPFVGSKTLKVVYVQITFSEVINVLPGTIDFEAKLWPRLISVFAASVFVQRGLSNSTKVKIDSLTFVLFDRNEE